ncbi:MAG: hypothetical protein ACXACW_13730 [Candidatus Hodarchaeales archaeon]
MNREFPRYRDFLTIQEKLEESCPVQVFAIGGTFLQGYINTVFTRDIDIVVAITSSVLNPIEILDPVLNDLDFKRVSTLMDSYFRFEKSDGLKLDVFINKVFMFTITPSILSRAINKKLSPEDVFLLKSQSTRGLDKEFTDLKQIISNITRGKFDYQIIVEEITYQLKNTITLNPQNLIRLLKILEAIEQLNEIFPDEVPYVFLNEIERIYSLHGIFE